MLARSVAEHHSKGSSCKVSQLAVFHHHYLLGLLIGLWQNFDVHTGFTYLDTCLTLVGTRDNIALFIPCCLKFFTVCGRVCIMIAYHVLFLLICLVGPIGTTSALIRLSKTACSSAQY